MPEAGAARHGHDVVDLLTGLTDRCVSLLGVSAAALTAGFQSALVLPLPL